MLQAQGAVRELPSGSIHATWLHQYIIHRAQQRMPQSERARTNAVQATPATTRTASALFTRPPWLPAAMLAVASDVASRVSVQTIVTTTTAPQLRAEGAVTQMGMPPNGGAVAVSAPPAFLRGAVANPPENALATRIATLAAERQAAQVAAASALPSSATAAVPANGVPRNAATAAGTSTATASSPIVRGAAGVATSVSPSSSLPVQPEPRDAAEGDQFSGVLGFDTLHDEVAPSAASARSERAAAAQGPHERTAGAGSLGVNNAVSGRSTTTADVLSATIAMTSPPTSIGITNSGRTRTNAGAAAVNNGVALRSDVAPRSDTIVSSNSSDGSAARGSSAVGAATSAAVIAPPVMISAPIVVVPPASTTTSVRGDVAVRAVPPTPAVPVITPPSVRTSLLPDTRVVASATPIANDPRVLANPTPRALPTFVASPPPRIAAVLAPTPTYSQLVLRPLPSLTPAVTQTLAALRAPLLPTPQSEISAAPTRALPALHAECINSDFDCARAIQMLVPATLTVTQLVTPTELSAYLLFTGARAGVPLLWMIDAPHARAAWCQIPRSNDGVAASDPAESMALIDRWIAAFGVALRDPTAAVPPSELRMCPSTIVQSVRTATSERQFAAYLDARGAILVGDLGAERPWIRDLVLDATEQLSIRDGDAFGWRTADTSGLIAMLHGAGDITRVIFIPHVESVNSATPVAIPTLAVSPTPEQLSARGFVTDVTASPTPTPSASPTETGLGSR